MASTLPDDAVLALYSLVTRELEQSSSEDRHLSADNDDALNYAADALSAECSSRGI